MKEKNSRIDEKKTGANIARYMKKANLSIPNFAKNLDVSDNAVRNYIKGINLPDSENMYMICKFLDVDIKDLIVEKKEEITNETV